MTALADDLAPGAPPSPDELPLPRDVLDRLRHVTAVRRSAEVEVLLLACDWADRHPVLDGPDEVRDDLEARRVARRRIAAGWLADSDPGLPSDYNYAGSWEQPHDPWIPLVAWHAGAPFATAIGVSTAAGERLIRDSLFLRHRMPRLWARVRGHQVEAWRARRIAQTGWGQPADVVAALDAEVTPRAHSIGSTGLDRLIDELMLRLHPEERELDQIADREEHHVTLHEEPTPAGFAEMSIRADYVDAAAFDRACSEIAEVIGRRQQADGLVPESLGVRRATAVGILADPARALAMLQGRDGPVGEDLDPNRPLAPGITLFVHVGDDFLRGSSAVTLAGLQGKHGRGGALRVMMAQAVNQWCNRPGTAVKVQPVIDLREHKDSVAENPTSMLRLRAGLRRSSCIFPWCERPATACDADHCLPSAEGGPTCDCNLNPLCRRHHRYKTLAGWSYTPLETSVTPIDRTETASPEADHPGPAVSWLWRSPHGLTFLVDSSGTRDVSTP